MSKWTHVNAIIRIDALRFPGAPKTPINLGTMSLWGDDHEAKDIPYGSEGSLQYLLWENPSKSSLAAYTVSVFGDLRDYEDKDEIIAYLEQITEGHMVRSGVAHINIEYKCDMVLQYQSEHNKWTIIHYKNNE